MNIPTEVSSRAPKKTIPSVKAGDLITPKILVVDDEKQIHSSLKLRLGNDFEMTCVSDARAALNLLECQIFDLCIVDIHMPEMDGLTFVEAAQKIDPALGYVVLSGHDSDDNLRRAIPLQVLEFIAKPLPNRTGFERRVTEWIVQTRQRRREQRLAKDSETVIQDLELVRIERDVASTASESAHEALLRTAGLLSTIQALLLSLNQGLEPLHRLDPRLASINRTLQEARRNAETAGTIAEGYFCSAYADRDRSPALIDTCLCHARDISLRLAKAGERRQNVDIKSLGREQAVTGLTGIDFLLMFVPMLMQTLALAEAGTTLRIQAEDLIRLDDAIGRNKSHHLLWINRRSARISNPGIQLTIRANCASLEETVTENWLRGASTPTMSVPSRGLLHGLQKSQGLLGIAVRPKAERFEMILALPV